MAAASVAAAAGSTISLTLRHRPLLPSAALLPRRPVAARLHSSRSNGSLSNDDKEEKQQQQYQESIYALPSPAPPSSAKNFAPVFVTLPANAVGSNGKVTRRRTMAASFAALAAAGVEGVAVELWWGVVERAGPGAYDWEGYLDLVALAGRWGLKVRAIMAFHQSGTGPGDPQWKWIVIVVSEQSVLGGFVPATTSPASPFIGSPAIDEFLVDLCRRRPPSALQPPI